MIDLAELLRLEQAATPAPWQEGDGYDSDAIVHPLPSYEVPIAGGGSFTERPRPETVFSGGSVGYENASLSASAEDKAFVIALRNAAPELLAELALLRELVGKLPKCNTKGCDRIATYMWWGADEWACDEHTPDGRKASSQLEYADIIRCLAAPGVPDG